MMVTPQVASRSSEKEAEKEKGDIISRVAIFYEKGAGGNNYVR